MPPSKKPSDRNPLPGQRVVTLALWLVAGIALALGLRSALKTTSAPKPESPALPAGRTVTYSRDIAPIVYRHCSGCHRPGDAAPFPLLSYADAKKHAQQIAEVTRRRVMPPWLPERGHNEFVGERYLSETEIALLARWAEQGAPEGNPADAPPYPTFSGQEWKLGKPDLVVRLPQPYALAADGKDVYRNFVIPVPIPSRRYVRAIEFNPGNPKTVHHAFMLLDTSGDSRRRDAEDPDIGFPGLHAPPGVQAPAGHFLSWQPGKLATADADELAWPLETGTDLILQVHLRSTGKPEQVQPSVAFYFTETRPTRAPFKFGLWTHAIDIPAGSTNHTVAESFTLPADVEIIRVLPHAHYLGKQLRAWATLPDGKQQWLVNIPAWDFNWQGDYAYRKPVALPKGAVIHMAYTFDNSTNNPANPSHPPQRVTYGVNSGDEMAEFWLQVLTRSTNDTALIEKEYQPRLFRSTISYNSYLLRQDLNNAKAHTEIGKAHLFLSQHEEAARFLRRSIELKPGEDEPHYYLGLLWRVTGRFVEAQAEFEAAVRANPNNHKAHGNLGLVHLQEGRIPEAEIHLRAALRINPGDAVAQQALDELGRQRGRK